MGAAHDNTVFVDINCNPMRTLAFVMTMPLVNIIANHP